MLKLRMKPSIVCRKGDKIIRYHIANNMIILSVEKSGWRICSKVCAMSLGGVQSDIFGSSGMQLDTQKDICYSQHFDTWVCSETGYTVAKHL